MVFWGIYTYLLLSSDDPVMTSHVQTGMTNTQTSSIEVPFPTLFARVFVSISQGKVLVKKSYRDKRKRHGRRPWKLQHLEKDEEGMSKREEEAAQSVLRLLSLTQ